MPPSALGGLLDGGTGERPEACTRGRSSAVATGNGSSDGHGEPIAGEAGGKSSRSAACSARSSGVSAPTDVSSSVGPPATERRTFVSCALLVFELVELVELVELIEPGPLALFAGVDGACGFAVAGFATGGAASAG